MSQTLPLSRSVELGQTTLATQDATPPDAIFQSILPIFTALLEMWLRGKQCSFVFPPASYQGPGWLYQELSVHSGWPRKLDISSFFLSSHG